MLPTDPLSSSLAEKEVTTQLNVSAANRFIAAALGGEDGEEKLLTSHFYIFNCPHNTRVHARTRTRKDAHAHKRERTHLDTMQ